MNIDQAAPMTARQEIHIAAQPEKAWVVLTDIERWPEWQAGVSAAKLEGNLAVGTTFKWRSKGANITSTIQELVSGERIAWTGSSIGIEAIHIWTFMPREDGTQVITEESMSGWFPRLLKILYPAYLEKSLDGSLRALKSRVERQ